MTEKLLPYDGEVRFDTTFLPIRERGRKVWYPNKKAKAGCKAIEQSLVVKNSGSMVSVSGTKNELISYITIIK